ncbi:unnamed protein product [Brachionus calyciflorus]|uniref:Gametogenetin-binding protein 2 n=1 Tax=Brachionus calyciflorus TaxID=104777 RepID=A0A814A9Y6_9BILA|nr:unnamed protein product [Brachionus calyciflorus]
MINAKIIDAFEEDQSEPILDKCQIDLSLDDCPYLIIQFDDLKCWIKDENITDSEPDPKLLNKCKSCQDLNSLEKMFKSNKEYTNFLNKYTKLKQSISSQDELLTTTKTDLMNTISSLVSCVGCRASLERFYRNQTHKLTRNNSSNNFSNVIYPFLIKSNDTLTLNRCILNDPFKLYSIFNLKNSKIELKSTSRLNSLTNLTHISNNTSTSDKNSIMLINPSLISYIQIPSCLNSNICHIVQPNSNTSTNKNRRCQMHSLDKNRLKSINDWLLVWDSFLKNSTRNKILLIDTSKLMITLDSYLKRHKFCSDCKLKVIRAYNILIGEIDPSKEKGFCASLYEGIECCSIKNNEKQTVNSSQNSKKSKFHLNCQHLHLKNDKQFIANLIYKAEPEIRSGGRRERHAKTLDIAQEEVLTCIGIHLFERFFRIYQTIRLEEQLWQLMVYSSIVTLKKAFELKYEQLQGVSNLELLCAQLEAEDQKKKIKKGKKKTKSDKKKDQSKNETFNEVDDEIDESDYLENLTSQSSQESKGSEENLFENEYEITSKQSSPIEPSFETSCGCSNDNQLSSFTSLTSSASSSSAQDLEYSFTSLNNDLDFELNENEPIENNDDLMLITDEEKNEYYANKTVYLNERTNRRLQLRERFQNLKLNSNFKLRPRI